MRVKILNIDPDSKPGDGFVVLHHPWQDCTTDEFVKLYFSGKYQGTPILSMEWEDKGETFKLIFGD